MGNIQILITHHYKCCSRDIEEEIEEEEDDKILEQLPVLEDDKQSDKSFSTIIN